MEKQAQQAADEHALQQVQLNHWTLDNANLTHTMDFQKKLEPLKLQEAQSVLQERQMVTVKSAQDMGLTNGRRVDSYDQFNKQDAQDIAKGKKIALTNFDGSATLYDVPSDPFKTQNTRPFEIATWSTGKDGKPVRQVVGTVDTGKGTVANQLAALNSENKSYAEVYGKYIDTQAKTFWGTVRLRRLLPPLHPAPIRSMMSSATLSLSRRRTPLTESLGRVMPPLRGMLLTIYSSALWLSLSHKPNRTTATNHGTNAHGIGRTSRSST